MSSLSKDKDLLTRAKEAVRLGTVMGARGRHHSNIYNIADEMVAEIERLQAELAIARGEEAEEVPSGVSPS